MPIRFRCQHCNQLIGIARRKAGTEVACPRCRRQVLVPPADVEEVAVRAAPPHVFERSEFEAYLRDVEKAPPAPRLMPPAPLPPARLPEPVPAADPSLVPFSSAAGPAPDYPNGIVLSPTLATVLTVESSDIVGPAVRMPVGGMSAIIENLVFLRFVEHSATLSRLISISKMRNSDYDEHVRELFITDKGMKVGDPLYGLDGVITGIPRTRPIQAGDRKAPARRKK